MIPGRLTLRQTTGVVEWPKIAPRSMSTLDDTVDEGGNSDAAMAAARHG